MATKKKKSDTTETGVDDIIASVQTSQEAFDLLSERGYDEAQIASFAAATRSWQEKGTIRRVIWEGVEELVKERRR